MKIKEEELIRLIEEQEKKVARLNKFSESMHFLEDCEVIERYQIIFSEERKLSELRKVYNEFLAEKENEEKSQ